MSPQMNRKVTVTLTTMVTTKSRVSLSASQPASTAVSHVQTKANTQIGRVDLKACHRLAQVSGIEGSTNRLSSGFCSMVMAHGVSELRELFQFFHALLDVGTLGLGGGVQTKTFAAERGGDAAINHRAADVRINRTLGAGEITHHAADERIARAGRIHDLVQRIRGADEKSFRAGQNRAVRTFFDDDVFWPQRVDFFQ